MNQGAERSVINSAPNKDFDSDLYECPTCGHLHLFSESAEECCNSPSVDYAYIGCDQ